MAKDRKFLSKVIRPLPHKIVLYANFAVEIKIYLNYFKMSKINSILVRNKLLFSYIVDYEETKIH